MARRRVGQEIYEWDDRLNNGLGGYRNRNTGRVASVNEVQNSLLRRIENSTQALEDVSLRLARGEISLAQWQTTMRDNMKIIYTYSGALAGGGWQNMSNRDWLIVARASKHNYRYLQNFALEIQNGQYPITHVDGRVNGRFIQRARLYGLAGRNTYFNVERQRAVESGLDFLRSVRNARDSCAGCISQEALGIVPINDPRIIPIGSRDCLRKCLCIFEYFTAAQVSGQTTI